MANTHQPLLTTTVVAQEDIPRFSFVGFDGKAAQAGAKALGVCEADTSAGEACPVNTHGILLVKLTKSASVGSPIGITSSGVAVVSDTSIAEGYSLDDGVAGDVIRIVRGI